jgi:hypothetical protein
MRARQVSVFVENRPGRLQAMLRALKQAGINIKTIFIADTAGFGIARLMLSDIDKGAEALRKAGFTLTISDVLAVTVPDTPGSLLETVITPLAAAGVNIDYIYSYPDLQQGKGIIILKVGDPDKAERVLEK